MVEIIFNDNFKKDYIKIKDELLKEKIIKQIQKIKENPEIGKPMRYSKKGTRELYISPYRISYYIKDNIIYISAFALCFRRVFKSFC